MSSSSETAKKWMGKIIEYLALTHEIIWGTEEGTITDITAQITRASACCDDFHGLIEQMKELPSQDSGWIKHRESPHNTYDVEEKITKLQKELNNIYRYFKGWNKGKLLTIIDDVERCRELAQNIEDEIQFWEYISQKHRNK